MNAPQLIDIPRGALNAHGYIGASDVPVILGVGKWDTPVQLQHRILNRVVTDDDTIALRFGQHNEEFVAQEYERITARALRRYNTPLRSAALPMLTGHPDRLVIPPGAKIAAHRGEIRTDTGWEGKTHDERLAYLYGDEWTDAVPEWELVQCAAYMMLSNLPRWHLAVLIGTKTVRCFELRRDHELEGLIAARVQEWWQRHIVHGVLCDPQDDEDLHTLYPQDDGGTVEADMVTEARVAHLRELKAKSKSLDEDIAAQELAVKRAFGTAATLTRDGNPIATWKTAKPRTMFDLSGYLAAQIPGATSDEIALYEADVKRNYTTKGAASRRLLIK